jgi:hypothetical protein
MKRTLQIFSSSTFTDLIPETLTAVKAYEGFRPQYEA